MEWCEIPKRDSCSFVANLRAHSSSGGVLRQGHGRGGENKSAKSARRAPSSARSDVSQASMSMEQDAGAGTASIVSLPARAVDGAR